MRRRVDLDGSLFQRTDIEIYATRFSAFEGTPYRQHRGAMVQGLHDNRREVEIEEGSMLANIWGTSYHNGKTMKHV